MMTLVNHDIIECRCWLGFSPCIIRLQDSFSLELKQNPDSE